MPFCIDIVARYAIITMEELKMAKNISISIRVSDEELEKFKLAARLEAYASYSEFIRRTALIEASRVLDKNGIEGTQNDGGNR